MSDVLGFEEFYESTRHRVVAFLYAVCGDRSEAQDAAQEAYARAWQRWSRLGSYDDPEAWVRTVGYRLVVNAWRRARNRLLAYRRHGAAVSQPDPAPEAALTVQAALRRLPPEQRLVVVMHHLLDLSVADIAHQTGIPANTVKTRLARGRRRMAELIGTELPEEAANA
jgi:RNA polymerase sigma-70 factor (sigma-E family)